MQYFCFNDCFPLGASKYELIIALKNSFTEYSRLKAIFPQKIDGIITQSDPRQTYLNDDKFTLLECVEGLDRPLRTTAYRVFSKFPIEGLLNIANPDDLIVEDYSLYISDKKYNAINVKITLENDGFLFSLAIHSDLEKDLLEIIGINTSHTVCNLFGTTANSKFLEDYIRAYNNNKLGKFDYFPSLFKNKVYGGRFKKGFESAPVQIQDAIIQHFLEAINRKGPSLFYADGSLIKDVTNEKEKKVSVFELRIFAPAAYRVYFYETSEITYLAMIEPKPAKRSQSGHIQSAHDIIRELLITK